MVKKKIPVWYLVVVILFLCYGTLSIYMNDTFTPDKLIRLAIVNLIITVVFIVFNMVMLGKFLNNDYENEAVILASYYVLINVLNAFNIQFRWLDVYSIERLIAMGTKVLEILFIGRIFYLKNKRKNN